MKKTTILFSLFALLLLQVKLYAQDDEKGRTRYQFVKTKSLNKTYSVAASDKLNIANSFGNVNIHTWNKNEIKVDVNVEVSATKEAVAQRIIDDISVSEKRAGDEITFKTTIKNNSKGNDKTTTEVNYTVYMPDSNPLTISNEFGDINVPDFKGPIDLTSKFSTLTAGNLSNPKNIHVEFGDATFAGINNANAVIKFSSAKLGRLSGTAKLKLEFCEASKLELDNGLHSLEINTSYSTVNLRPAAGFPGNYNISTSFGEFDNRTGVKFTSDEDDDNNSVSPKFDNKYEGKSGAGTIPVKVKSSFGKIIIGEVSDEELSGEKGEKGKGSKPRRKTV